MLTDRSVLNTDNSVLEEEEEISFKVRYNMTKNNKENLMRLKYAKRQRVVRCEEKLIKFIQKYYNKVVI